MPGGPDFLRRRARLGPSLLVLGIAVAVAALFAGSTYFVGKRWEDQKHFLKNFRPPNDYEAHSAFSMDYALNSSEDNDVVVLGDSTCLSGFQSVFFERSTGLKAFNLGTMGILGIDGYDLLFRTYLARHPRPRLVVFSVLPVALSAQPSEQGPVDIRERFFWSFARKNSAKRPRHDLVSFYFVRQGAQAVIGHLTGGLERYARQPIPRRGGDTLVSLSQSLRENRGYWAHPGVLDASTRRKGSGLEWVDSRLNIPPDDPFPISDENRELFRKLVHFLREQDIPLLIRLSPVLVSEGPERYDHIRAWGLGLEKEFPGVIVGRPEVVAFPSEEFGERNHVNRRGAEHFTAIVSRDVMRIWPTIQKDASTTSLKRD